MHHTLPERGADRRPAGARRRQPRPVALALSLSMGFMLAPALARAQTTSRTFEACVYGPFQTCSSFALTTTARLNAAGRPFAGTDVDLLVRQTTLSDRATGLSALSFLYSRGLGSESVYKPVSTFGATGEVPAPVGPTSWLARGLSNRLDLIHAQEDVVPGPPAGATQFIAGCAGGQFAGDLLATPLVTCLPGAYRFQFTTAVNFSAANVAGFGFDLYAGTDDGAPNGRTVSCAFDAVAPLGGACLDFANLDDPFVEFGAPVAPPVGAAVVPEPATAALLGAGLLALAAAARRRA